MSLFSRIQLQFGYRQVVAQNHLTSAQETHLASVTDRGFLVDLWIKSLKQKADVVLTFLWNHHPDMLQEKEVQHALSHCLRFRQAPPVLLSFSYGNQVPHLTEAMVAACRNHDPSYVRSFLHNHVEMDENVVDALFAFFFSYDWREDDIEEWKDLYSLFLTNRDFLTEDGTSQMHTLGIDLLPLHDIHTFSDIRSIERYVFSGYDQTIILLLTEPLACIKTAIALKKRRQSGVDWFVKHVATLLLLKKADILQALFEAYPELTHDSHILEYFMPMSSHDFQSKLNIVKEIGITINDSPGIDALLHEWRDSLFNGGRTTRHFVFLIGAGLHIWQGKHETLGISLLTHLTEERKQKRRFYISHIEREFHVFLRQNVMEWIEENEPHMGDGAKKAYRLYHYEHDIFA